MYFANILSKLMEMNTPSLCKSVLTYHFTMCYIHC